MIPFESEFPVREILPIHMPGLPCWHLEKAGAASLYVQGRPEAVSLLAELPERGLAVVGTRRPHARSVHLARSWIRALAGKRLVLNSGFANGIDTVAHEAALESGLRTVAFLGTPLEADYPRGKRTLRRGILEAGGLLVSEYPPGTRTLKGYFCERNRLIAAFSKAVLVVEAGQSSGTLNTAKWTVEFARHLYAAPCSPGDPRFAGNQKLLDERHAKNFWGIHSLSESWFELAGRRADPREGEDSIASRLLALIRDRTYEAGGLPMDEAIAWAMERQWVAGEFFSWLEDNLASGRLLNRGGVLTAADAS